MNNLSIKNAKYLDGHKIQIEFSDGEVRTVNFYPFLNSSKHPGISKYLDLKLFQQFQIVDGDLDWNDFDLNFPIWDLYTGKILKTGEIEGQEAS